MRGGRNKGTGKVRPPSFPVPDEGASSGPIRLDIDKKTRFDCGAAREGMVSRCKAPDSKERRK